jgi:DNA-directed RNA polymerase subunit RPC12/RpoP
MKCLNCWLDKPDGARFCSSCGRSMGEMSYADLAPGTVVVCPNCGTKNFRTDRIYRNCETDLTATKMVIIEEQAK